MNTPGDLRLLTREGRADDAAAPGRSAARSSAVPLPPLKWKTRLLLPAGILLTVGGMLLYTARDALWPATPVRVVPVVLKTVALTEPSTESSFGESGRGVASPQNAAPNGAVVVQAPGWVEANPFSISVAALTDGVVREVLALEGQPVKKGEVVARLVDDDARLALAAAEAELGQAQADLQIADAALRAAQTDWDNPVERQKAIAVNEAMVREYDAEHQQMEHQLKVEQAKAEELRQEHQRKRQAFEQNAASEFEVVQLELRAKAQTSVIESVRAHAQLSAAKVERAAAECLAATENLRLRVTERKALDEAKANLARAQAALAKAKTARDEAQLRLDRMEVRSPIDGVVQERLVEPGMRLMLASDAPNAATAVRLYDPKKLQVRVDVPLASAARVGVGQKALIVVDVLPDKTFTGTVVRTVHQADLQKNTQQVKVAIDDPDPALKPEMLARVRFLAGAAPAANTGNQSNPTRAPQAGAARLFAPEHLLRRPAPDRTETWVADRNGTVAARRTLQLGAARFEGWVEVVGGLNPGDKLLVSDRPLSEGERIRITGEENGLKSNPAAPVSAAVSFPSSSNGVN